MAKQVITWNLSLKKIFQATLWPSKYIYIYRGSAIDNKLKKIIILKQGNIENNFKQGNNENYWRWIIVITFNWKVLTQITG